MLTSVTDGMQYDTARPQNPWLIHKQQVSKKIPLEDPNTMNLVRAGYVLSNLIIAGIYAYTHFIINKKKGKQNCSQCAYEQMLSTVQT